MKLYHFFLVLILIVACEAACQQHYFRQYAHSEGLVHSFVYDMVQDDNGFMWIGTPNGLYRFDGFAFEYFTVEQGLTENFVARLFKDSQGNIWVGHQNGAVTLMNNEGFTSPVEESENQGSVTDITEDESGSIWITTQKTGLININKDHLINRVTFPNEYESLTHLEHIGGEKFLIGTQESLYLTRYNSVEFSMEILERIEDYPGSKVVDIVPDANLGYVVVSQEDGIYILLSVGAPGEFQLMAIDQNLDGSLDNLQGGLIDENGSLWLYSMGSGLVEYRETVDLLFSRTTRITSDNGLVNDNVRSLFEDLEGNLWIGMYGEGLLRYVDDNIKFFTYNANEEQSIKTTALAGDTTNFLVVTGNRLLRINQIGDTVLNTYELPVNRLGDRVNSAFLDNVGRIWLGYEQSGLYLSS
ncbi:MAG: hypothetical protein GY790_18885, partial [Bacteroidetes bacterium]|nr:hypothetical protein [Bacteroidota bacterium]